MTTGSTDQSILVPGESDMGKTVTSNRLNLVTLFGYDTIHSQKSSLIKIYNKIGMSERPINAVMSYT